MSETILKIENLSKQYRLGTVGTGTISDDLKRWCYNLRGKEDPFLKIGDVNDRSTKGTSDYVWALKDINFEVKKGVVLGIIGKNGAGKSTLLKILSKITSPTTGSVKFNGRVASLLEVGTGFHGEMTGRENIFLNGAILGMTKKEITAKYDEIVEFSGCERYIDTPVKRYSSGMTVRLAFAVAAFLEPDILIIDEVLAVGDAEFQMKAIGKMQDISKGEGRTVLFVSHDMTAIRNLCPKTLLLKNGEVFKIGKTDDIISVYLKDSSEEVRDVLKKSKYLKSISIKSNIGNNIVEIGDDLEISIKFKDTVNGQFDYCYLGFEDEDQKRVFSIGTHLDNNFDSSFHFSKTLKCVVPSLNLVKGRYKVLVAIGTKRPYKNIELVENALFFVVHDSNYYDNGVSLSKSQGFVVFKPYWSLNKY